MSTLQQNTAQQLYDARARLKTRLDENQALMHTMSHDSQAQDAAFICATLKRCLTRKRRLLCDLDAAIGV